MQLARSGLPPVEEVCRPGYAGERGRPYGGRDSQSISFQGAHTHTPGPAIILSICRVVFSRVVFQPGGIQGKSNECSLSGELQPPSAAIPPKKH